MDNDIVLVHPVDLAPADHSTKKDYARKYHLVDPPFNDNLRHEERRASRSCLPPTSSSKTPVSYNAFAQRSTQTLAIQSPPRLLLTALTDARLLMWGIRGRAVGLPRVGEFYTGARFHRADAEAAHAEHEDSLCSEPTLIPPCAASRLASFNTLLFKELMTYFTTRWPICWKSQARGIEYASPSPKKPSHTKGVRAAGRGGHFGGASSELDMIDLADKLQSRHRLRAIQQRLRRAPRYDLPESGQHYDEKTQQDAWFAPPPTSGAVADASLGGVALRVVAGMVGASMGVVAAPPAPAAPADTEAANAGRGTSTPNGTNANQSEFRIFPYHAPHLVPFEAAVRALNPAGAVLVRNAAVTAAVGRVPSSHQSLNLDAETRIQVLARTADLPGAEKAQCGAFIRTPPSLVLWAPQVESLIPLVAEFEEKLFKYDCTASDLHSYCRHLPPLVGVIVAHSPALALSLLFSI
ncbi:hypothetical protein B0H16DRAFT_1749374 [Mycena metata]|uniref:DUF7928 domain-containing protein n=1 Tax=Mycena metata TaxID=1033252 RepID=A0AAD7DVT6_9AGAR|nr:hypothetical protein B0H16DRAFT_1749374 [Mycena metata]